MMHTLKLKASTAIIMIGFFIGLSVFSTIDQYALSAQAAGIELPWFASFKVAYDSFLAGMFLFLIFYSIYGAFQDKNLQIKTLKSDVIRTVFHMKNGVEIPDVDMLTEPESAIECRTSDSMIKVLTNMKAFKEIESKVKQNRVSDITSESSLFSEQLLNKFKPSSTIIVDGAKEELLKAKPFVLQTKESPENLTVGIQESENLVNAFSDAENAKTVKMDDDSGEQTDEDQVVVEKAEDQAPPEETDKTQKIKKIIEMSTDEMMKDLVSNLYLRFKKLTKYRMYYIALKTPILLDKKLIEKAEKDPDVLVSNGINYIMVLSPGELYRVLKFKEQSIYIKDSDQEMDARVARVSLKFVRSLLPRLPLFVINDCSLSNDAFWEISFNSAVLADATQVALTFLTYFAIDESEDLRKELEKAKVNIVKLEVKLDENKDKIIEELILSKRMQSEFEKAANSVKKDPVSRYTNVILGIIIVVMIVVLLLGGKF